MLESVAAVQQQTPWNRIRWVEWEDVRDLDELFKSERLEGPHGRFFDQRFPDFLAENLGDVGDINWRQFEGLAAEFFDRQGMRSRSDQGAPTAAPGALRVRQGYGAQHDRPLRLRKRGGRLFRGTLGRGGAPPRPSSRRPLPPRGARARTDSRRSPRSLSSGRFCAAPFRRRQQRAIGRVARRRECRVAHKAAAAEMLAGTTSGAAPSLTSPPRHETHVFREVLRVAADA
jgi:hypothetical protein